MKKIAILLAATMAFAINSNAQSMQSGYKGHVDAGYSVGIGDYDFGRFEVNTTHGYQVNPYIFIGAGTVPSPWNPSAASSRHNLNYTMPGYSSHF